MSDADIFYIEDNEDYIEFVKRAISKISDKVSLSVAMDGKSTLQLFEQTSTSRKVPKLILLDINLPDYNGIDLLKRLRSHEATRYVPIIMLSSSENQQDMKRSFDSGANAYIIKPVGIAPLTETLHSVYSFWLHHNQSVENFAA